MMPWYGYALLTMLAFGVTNFLLKYAAEKGMDSVFAAGLLWLAVGAVGLLFLVHAYLSGSFQENVKNTENAWLLAVPMLAGISLSVGMYTIKKAVSVGPAGPAVAIAAANAVLVAVLSWALLGEGLSPGKVLGMVLVMAGIVIMALF